MNELVDRAFSTTHPGEDDTAEYLIEVRKKYTYIPELSFVAVLSNGRIVGQVTLYHTDILTATGRITQLVWTGLRELHTTADFLDLPISIEYDTHI